MANAVNPAEDDKYSFVLSCPSPCLRGAFSYVAESNVRKEDVTLPSQKVLENKKAIVAQLTERFQNAQAGVLADYRGLTVAQDTALRVKMR
ncbi:MAG: 50S ribosomal protein L10, partial [Clostridia bacterium]|nr:50S ribosomal protein L10 [Clostridia bacterium]